SVLKLNVDYLFQKQFKRVNHLCDRNMTINDVSIYTDPEMTPQDWKSLYENYKNLGEGFRWVMIHWEYDRPELLKEIWQKYFRELAVNDRTGQLKLVLEESGTHTAEELIDRHKDYGPNEFKQFPKILRDALVEWSFGWVGTQRQIADLGNEKKLFLVDF